MVSCGLMLVGGASAASAQDVSRLTQVVPMSGTVTKGGQKGKQFTGTYTIQRFVNSGGKLYSVGTLKGKAGNKKVSKQNVRVPAAVANSGAASGARASQVPPLPLRIDAVQGPGNLLGNLLCGITGLLNPATGGTGVANTPLGQLVQILNALLALSPRTA
jgi:hypothetical protein